MDEPPRPSSASPGGAASPSGPGQGFRARSRQRRQRLQEEFAAVPSCAALYALVPPEMQNALQQLHPYAGIERPGTASGPESGTGRLTPWGLLPQGSPLPSPHGGLGHGVPPGALPLDQLHMRARSWDVNDLGRQMLAEAGQPWVCRAQLQGLSLAVECLINVAMVTLEGTWTIEQLPLPLTETKSLDCLFVLPLHEGASVCGVEVLPGQDRMLATAVVPQEEAELAVRHMALVHEHASRPQPKEGSTPWQSGQDKGEDAPPMLRSSTSSSLRQRLFPRSLSTTGSPAQSGSPGRTAGSRGRSLSGRGFFSLGLSPARKGVAGHGQGGGSFQERRPISATQSSTDNVTSPWAPAAGQPRLGGSTDEPMNCSPARPLAGAASAAPDLGGVEGQGVGTGSMAVPSGREGAGVGHHAETGNAPGGVETALTDCALLRRRVEPGTAHTLLNPPEGFAPCMLRLRIPRVMPGSQVRIRVTYLEPMQLQAGAFNEITVPLTVPPDCLPPDRPLHEAVHVSCMINSGVPSPMKVGDFNHPMKVLSVELGRATFVGFPDPKDPESWPNTNFVASYQVVSEDAHAGILVQAPVIPSKDPRATLCLSICLLDAVAPAKPIFPRAVVFLIDSNISLRSKHMDDARRAISTALKRLRPWDAFAVVAFDYELLTSADGLEAATPEAVKRACKFVLRAHDSGKGSNIFTPMHLALEMLKAHVKATPPPPTWDTGKGAGGAAAWVPQVVLITDGSAPDERGVCLHVQKILAAWGPNSPSVFTLGIGSQCNFYFLKWLASASRGSTEMVYNLDHVRPRLEKLLVTISCPAVTGVSIKDAPPGCELYPSPIPDLYLAVPVVVSGKIGAGGEEEEEGPMGLPSHLHLRGLHADGTVWRYRAPIDDAGNMPLNSVGVMEQLHILTADAWLNEDPAHTALALALSTAASVPEEHSSMVFFETSSALFSEFQRHRVQGTRRELGSYIVPVRPFLAEVQGLHRGFGHVRASQGRILEEASAPGPASVPPLKQQEQGGTGQGQAQPVPSKATAVRVLAPRVASGHGSVGSVEDGSGRDDENEVLGQRHKGLLGNALACYFPKHKR